MPFSRSIGVVLLAAAFSFPSFANAKEKRAAAALARAQNIVAQFQTTNDLDILSRSESAIEYAWDDLAYYHRNGTSITPALALIRAKATSKSKSRARIVEAWNTALRLQPENTPSAKWLSMNVAAGHATASVGETKLSSRYFAAARNYAFRLDRDSIALQLRLRIQELTVNGGKLPWRQMNDKILDMRRYSEGFTIWNEPRLEALLSEGELRIAHEPETDEKRLQLSNIKAHVKLAEKGLSENMRPRYINRIRAFYYALEDGYAL